MPLITSRATRATPVRRWLLERGGTFADSKSKLIANNINHIDILSYQDIPRTECETDNNSNSPHNRTALYVSLSRTAGILDKPVATINRLRNDPGLPRRYNFDTDSINGCPAIKRGPHFRLDKIQQLKQRAGEVGNCDPPPGERKPPSGRQGRAYEIYKLDPTHLSGVHSKFR